MVKLLWYYHNIIRQYVVTIANEYLTWQKCFQMRSCIKDLYISGLVTFTNFLTSPQHCHLEYKLWMSLGLNIVRNTKDNVSTPLKMYNKDLAILDIEMGPCLPRTPAESIWTPFLFTTSDKELKSQNVSVGTCYLMFSEVAEAREFHFSVDGVLIYCSISCIEYVWYLRETMTFPMPIFPLDIMPSHNVKRPGQ